LDKGEKKEKKGKKGKRGKREGKGVTSSTVILDLQGGGSDRSEVHKKCTEKGL
jgi:hypothetical protein